MDSEILNVINSTRGRDVSSHIVDEEPDSKIANGSRLTSGTSADEATQEILMDNYGAEQQPVTLDTIFSKLSMDKGGDSNSKGCNEAIGNDDWSEPELQGTVRSVGVGERPTSGTSVKEVDYNGLLNKYNEVNALHKQNLLVYNDSQYKYADAIGERDEKIAQLQKMRQIDLEYNTECKENCDVAIDRLNSIISTQNNEIEKQQINVNDLTSKLHKMNNEMEEAHAQLKKEIDSRTNKYYNEIAELHNINVLITQQLNEKITESDKLREQHTELITKMNQYTSFNNKQNQNDKPCAIQ